MITLYHGSNIAISEIELNKCKPNKDFGKGFYLTDIKEQAAQMALRRTRIAGEGEPIVTAYRFEKRLLSDLNVKIFEAPTEEWEMFILNNRSRNDFTHDYDIVIGPIADDGVAFQLERYERNMISLETLVKELTYRKLNKQYMFGTEKAITCLKKYE